MHRQQGSRASQPPSVSPWLCEIAESIGVASCRAAGLVAAAEPSPPLVHTSVQRTAAGGVAAGLVRYGLFYGRGALSTEVIEALLQLFVGLAAALAAVLVAAASTSSGVATGLSHSEAEMAAAAAPPPAPAAQHNKQLPVHQEEKEGAAAGDNGADDDALDESAAPLAPAHFVAACKGDVDKAQRRWDATRRWRREKGIDRLLFQPNTTMELARRYYPLWFHGRGRQGEVVLFEMAGAFSVRGRALLRDRIRSMHVSMR